MSINLNVPENITLTPRIIVFGVGGAGGNAVNNMELEGVSLVVANTDAQALQHSKAPVKVQLGEAVTRGLGAGASPDIGKAAAEESAQIIHELLEGSNMVFITAGMGGGTGTGAAPVIANIARSKGILTVGVVTKPFHFEGAHRMRLAEAGLQELQKHVDTLIVIPNQNLFRIANERTTFADAFKMADDVLQAGVRGVTDLITMPGLINLDFADIVTIMSKMGKAMMGTGEAAGENRAILAAEAAISNPLLDQTSMKGARGVLINITGGPDMTLFEVDEAANRIRDEVDVDANIIFGSTFNPGLEGKIRITVVATGIENPGNIISKHTINTPIEQIPVNQNMITEEKTQAIEDSNIMELVKEDIIKVIEEEVEEILSKEQEEETITEFEEELVAANSFSLKTQPQNKAMFNTANTSRKPVQTTQEVISEEPKQRSLFGRVASSVFGGGNSEKNKQNTSSDAQEILIDEQNLDIPAFLRRKQK